MRKSLLHFFFVMIIPAVLITSCSLHDKTEAAKTDPVEANIKMYSHVWDEIVNKGNLGMFNDSNFTKDVVMHMSPSDIVGIDTARAYYANFITGFSDIKFTIKDVFGQSEAMGISRTITKSKKNLLYEIDGKPALEMYLRFLGEDFDSTQDQSKSLPPDFDVIDTVVESARKVKEKDMPDADAMIVFSCVGRLVH